MTLKSKLMGAVTATALLTGVQGAMAEEITVAYFLEWPMPFQYAKETGMYEAGMGGTTINWVSFDTGTAMSAGNGVWRRTYFCQSRGAPFCCGCVWRFGYPTC